MTEQEWLTSTDPRAMLAALLAGGTASDRKLRLFACACCRRVWRLLADERSRRAVESAERYADGLADESEMDEAALAAWNAAEGEHPDPVSWYAARAAESAAWAHDNLREAWETARLAALAVEGEVVAADSPDEHRGKILDAWVEAHLGSGRPVGWPDVDAEREVADLIRDVCACPVRALPALAPHVLAWDDRCVVKLAAGIYADGGFSRDRLGVLADALEDAGCSDEAILSHLRSAGPHVRGCWAVDLILGRQ
jgi:hypothetical protein